MLVLLGFAGLLASTWKQLVQSLYIGLTGREWVIKAGALLTLLFLAAIGPDHINAFHPSVRAQPKMRARIVAA